MLLGHDSHNHLIGFSVFSGALDLTGLGKIQALAQIRAGRHALVTNWDNSKWGLTSQDLDFGFPVVVFNASFHGAVLNTTAQRKFGIEADASGLVNKPGLMRQLRVQLTGDLTKDDFKRLFLREQEKYRRANIYGVDDMGYYGTTINPILAVRELQQEGTLEMELGLFFRFPLLEQVVKEASRLMPLCKGLKVIADGAFGVWTAALFQPYCNKPDSRGIFYLTAGELEAQIRQTVEWRVPIVAVHCIGDAGIQRVLDVYQKLAAEGINTVGWRLEHAILINAQQAKLAKQLGIVLSMQPNFSSDTRYEDRLGKRVALINPFRMLVDEFGFEPGKDLIFGSDGMPTGLKEGLEWATNPSLPSQKLTTEETMAAYRVRPEGKR
jgi:predicted amidohydrolase YtcJ